MPAPDWTLLLRSPVFETTALLLGLVVGSFANVCVYRLPRRESIVSPPSRCPSCGGLIRARDNVPLLGWLLLRGRCRACGTPISPRYPAVEAANGLLWLALVALRGPRAHTFVAMTLVTALLMLSLIDFDHQILPDAITLPGIAVGLAASFLPGSPVRPLAALLAAAGGWLAFAAVAKVYHRVRGVEGLGQGDWKLAAMLGAFLGWQPMLLTVLIASVAGTLVGLGAVALRGRDMRHALPFGTFLGAAGIAVVFFGDPFLSWYRGLFGG
ncbi:MAG TPA: A24 family peptidase [Vicinamibacteria bacterium]|nr:A24 family peptidase [Vicinamibacteria bacterium]